MQAVVLAGGLGTRLAPAVSDVPKVLAPVGDRPFLARLIDWLAASGAVDGIVIAAGHGADQIARYCGTHDAAIPVTLSVEDMPLGTGGALVRAAARTTSEPVLALNGDSFVGVDLDALARAHAASGAAASVVAVRVADAAAFGTLRLDGDMVMGFEEKAGRTESAWINAGVYLFGRAVVDGWPESPSSLERDLLPGLIGGGLHAFACDAPFIDIGTPETYARAQTFFDA